MADILFDGLPVLDLLEITPSTSAVAALTQRDQSSISRIYRQVSRRLGLDFRKQPDGRYRAGCNQVLLEGLRLSSQWLRLQADPPEPRWLACGHAARVHPSPLPPQGGEIEQVLTMLQERILDLAVLTHPVPIEPLDTAPLTVLALLRHPHGVDQIVLRSDLALQPVLQDLIASLRHRTRQHLRQHPSLEWLG
ncbi:MAG: hypothetical protein FJ056_08460 [Cyanobacteria bacterium M_surface_10_m2_179]|nr:hypothetical protein [Cyanobacteria bacterium M_surface_10_m2_179]